MLHESTFEYLKPTQEQLDEMAIVRGEFAEFTRKIGAVLPEGADKTYLLRKLREVGMWANIALIRNADGSPRINTL